MLPLFYNERKRGRKKKERKKNRKEEGKKKGRKERRRKKEGRQKNLLDYDRPYAIDVEPKISQYQEEK